ncbi:MAG: 50S ribosomal protein L9 [Candidatus Omnitrophica bacterium]|nr:50S ribosomal protein L9 [Candidatus Omnitrophota bacterium]
MQVILAQDVERLGKAGQILTVKDGYARNFLIPKGWAFPAGSGQRSQIEARLRASNRREEALQAKAKELARRIEGALCVIPAAVGESGKLHGAVTAGDILESLKGQGIPLEKHQLVLTAPIAHLGVTSLPVKLHREVTALLKVEVVRK